MVDACLVHVEDGHPKIMTISIGSVGAKNTMQSLLRDIGQCCKEVPSIKSSKLVAKATIINVMVSRAIVHATFHPHGNGHVTGFSPTMRIYLRSQSTFPAVPLNL